MLLPTPAVSQINLFQLLIFTLAHGKNCWHHVAGQDFYLTSPCVLSCQTFILLKFFPRLTTLLIFDKQDSYMFLS